MAGARIPVETRALLWLGPVVGLAVCAWHNQLLQPWTLDDAYISFRYAENFASGNGLVYNLGERVEGYTTFLWVLILGIGNALGADTRVLAKALGALFAAASLALLSQAHRFERAIPREAGAIAAALVGSCGIFSAWAMPGMEVPLVALLLLSAALLYLRDRAEGDAWHGAGVVGALALMARPDSVVVMFALSMHAVRAAWSRRDWRALRPPLLTAAIYGPYFLWRWQYYGWLLPNTFYAKVGSSGAQLERGGAYLVDFLTPAASLWVPLLLLGVFAWTAWQRFSRIGVLLGAVVLHGVYVLSVGGDVMPAFRFFAGVLPILGLMAGVALSLLGRWAWIPVTLGVGFNLWQFEYHPDLRPRIERGVVGLRGEEVGVWLRENVDPDALLATNTAGSVPYFSGLRTIDMLGLNDAHIAHRQMPGMGKGRAGHEKADGAYVLSRSPDYVQMGSARGRDKPAFRSDRELFRQPGFRSAYRVKRYRLPSGATLTLWVKRSLLESGTAP